MEQPVRGPCEVVDPPRRLVFTWGFVGSPELPPGASSVEVTLTKQASGTRVELIHRGLPEPERQARAASATSSVASPTATGEGRTCATRPARDSNRQPLLIIGREEGSSRAGITAWMRLSNGRRHPRVVTLSVRV